jgi:hypothetical protein
MMKLVECLASSVTASDNDAIVCPSDVGRNVWENYNEIEIGLIIVSCFMGGQKRNVTRSIIVKTTRSQLDAVLTTLLVFKYLPRHWHT